MSPYVLDEIQLLAGVGRKPEDLNPIAKPMDFFLGLLGGVTGAVVQHENDPFACAPRSLREKVEQADGLFGNRILPQPMREEKRTIRVSKGSAHSDSAVLTRRFDAEGFTAQTISVGGNRQQVEPHAVCVPQFEIRPRSQTRLLEPPEAFLGFLLFSPDSEDSES